MNRASVFERHKRFKKGRESVRDDERCGRSKEVNRPEMIGQRVRFRVTMLRFLGSAVRSTFQPNVFPLCPVSRWTIYIGRNILIISMKIKTIVQSFEVIKKLLSSHERTVAFVFCEVSKWRYHFLYASCISSTFPLCEMKCLKEILAQMNFGKW